VTALVVARPVYVIEELVPPTNAPKIPDVRSGEPETEKEDVATLCTREPCPRYRDPPPRPERYVFPELVSCVEEAYVTKVEEAMRPYGVAELVIQRPVDVALTACVPYVDGVNGNADALMVRLVPPIR
jgi:hypothetical protein